MVSLWLLKGIFHVLTLSRIGGKLTTIHNFLWQLWGVYNISRQTNPGEKFLYSRNQSVQPMY